MYTKAFLGLSSFIKAKLNTGLANGYMYNVNVPLVTIIKYLQLSPPGVGGSEYRPLQLQIFEKSLQPPFDWSEALANNPPDPCVTCYMYSTLIYVKLIRK